LFAVDTNVLVYAAHDGAPEQAACRALLERWRTGDEEWCLTWSVIYEFLTVTTRRGVFTRPLRTSEAWTLIDGLVGVPSLTILGHGPMHLAVIGEIMGAAPDIRGAQLNDAHIAALMREHGVRTIYTRDRGFRRFPFLEVIDPLSA
jgi:uncharacterized protein